jgi:hypothetical protein
MKVKQRCTVAGAIVATLTLTIGCGAAREGDLFDSSVQLPERMTPDNAGSSPGPEALGLPSSATPSRPAASAPEGAPNAEGTAPASGNIPAAGVPTTSSGAQEPDAGPGGPAIDPEPVPPPACVLGEFGPLEKVSGLGLAGPLWGPALSAGDTGLFFVVTTATDTEQIFFASRSDLSSAQFSSAQAVPELASNAFDGTPFVSASGLSLYFYSTREGSNAGSRDLWVAQRSTPSGAFAAPTPLVELNTSSGEFLPRLSADELKIVFISQRPDGKGSTDIWQARRPSIGAPFGAPENLAEVNTDVDETGAWMSSDGLTIFFSSNRAGGQGRLDIWRATRTSVEERFGPAEDVPGLNSPSDELDVALSSSERELLLSSDRGGIPELWRAVRSCL